MYTHRGAYLNALAEMHHARLDSPSVYLWTLPMFHCNGWCFPWAVTAAGGTHVCLRKVDPGRSGGCSTRAGDAPQRRADGARDARRRRRRRTQLERPMQVTTAAAPPSPTVIARMEALGFEIDHVYGLTETYGPITICEWHPEWDARDAPERARLQGAAGRRHADRRPGPRGRRRDARRAARRRDDGRGRHARQQRDEGLLRRRGGDGRRRSAAAGSTPATSG